MKRIAFAALVLSTAFLGCKKEEPAVEPVADAAMPPIEEAPVADAAVAPADAAAGADGSTAAVDEGDKEGDWIKLYAWHNPAKPTDPVEVNVKSFKVVEAKFDPANLKGSMAKLELNLDSIQTDSDKRDAHLRTPDYLDVSKFPKAVVEIKDVKNKSGDVYSGKAKVTAHGVNMTFPVEFKVTRSADGKVMAEGEHTFKRTDFKVGKPEGTEGEGTAEKVQIKMRLTLESAG